MLARTSTHLAAAKAPALKWERDVPILTNWLVLSAIVRVFVLAALLMIGLIGFLFAIQGEWRLIGPLATFVAAIDGGVVVIGTLAAALIYGNRLRYRFSVDDKVAVCERIDRRATIVGRLTLLLGIVFGKPGAAGVGLISESTTRTSTNWPSVVRITEHPSARAIALHNPWRTTLILFCEPGNYDAVLARVKAAHRANAPRQRANPLPRLMLRTALVAAACVPLFKLPAPIDPFAPYFVLCFALASVWLIPLLAWAVLGGLAVIAGMAVLAGLAPYTSYITHETMRRYDIFSGDDWASATLALLGAAYLVWLSLALLRGRVQSALLGDLVDMEDASS
jgi:hypothetical protein